MQFTRFLHNCAVTATEMAAYAGERTAAQGAGRDVVVIQDTSELALGGRRAKANGYGPVGKGGALRGLLLHAVLAVDAGTGGLIGLVDAQVSNRKGGKVGSRRLRKTAEKESQRWIDGTTRAGEVLMAANSITGVSDRESDIYEHFAARPANMHLIVRACQNRVIEAAPGMQSSALLFSLVDCMAEQGRFSVMIPAAPGRKERTTELAVRFTEAVLRKPRHAKANDNVPETLEVTIVDVRETSVPVDAQPVHWRLLTTHAVRELGAARRIVDLYRLRWTIEEFFHTLKTVGFDIEAADIGDPEAMIRLVAAATVAAVTVMQLVKARDGTTGQPLADAFEPADLPVFEAISPRLEGKTTRQKNPHPKGSLAFAAWVIARLGGWTGYYGKPGPKVMRRGLEDFHRIKFGTTLSFQNV